MTTDNLWNKKALSISSPDCMGRDPSPEILQNWQAVSLSGPKRLHCNWLEDTLILKTRIFGDFELSRTFRCCAGLLCRCCYISATVHTAVTSQARGLPPCRGTSVRSSGRLPSDRTKPCGSLELGIPTEVKARATRSFNACCLVIFPGAFLHTTLWRPCASTKDPQWQLWGTKMAIPSLTLTAILTVSSSRQRPHGDMSSANSQSPPRGDDAARNEASWKDVLRLDSTKARSAAMPGRSQTYYFAGKASGTSPKESDHDNKYRSGRMCLQSRHIRTGFHSGGRVCSWTFCYIVFLIFYFIPSVVKIPRVKES